MQNEQGNNHHNNIETQQKLYHAYALAAEAYVKKPTIINWEKKEKAFEIYNALISKNLYSNTIS